jgi:hypothetical protein
MDLIIWSVIIVVWSGIMGFYASRKGEFKWIAFSWLVFLYSLTMMGQSILNLK